MQPIDRADFATFMTLWITAQHYSLGDIDYDTYIEALDKGMDVIIKIFEQIKASEDEYKSNARGN